MTLITILLALLVALAAAWLMRRGRSTGRPDPGTAQAAVARPPRMLVPAAPVSPVTAVARVAPVIGSSGLAPPAAPAPAEFFPMPPEVVAGFDWHLATALPEAQRQALVMAIGRIRRPPAALQQMLSPAFLDRASSQDLSELINGEAQLAAKVLATVNAPLYGLQRPVASIGQAVTFLGLNTVRGICLRDLLDASFPAGNPALQAAYRDIWNASALASELCNRLSARLGLADAGALVAQVLLSFLGHLATVTLLAAQGRQTLPPGAPLLDRTRQAQDTLGLGAAELGALLLRAWGLPDSIVDEVRAIDRLLLTPASRASANGHRLAVAHLCARLGEQLATTSPATGGASLAGMAAGLAENAHGFHLRHHLAHPSLARLGEHLQAPDLVQQVLVLQQGLLAQR